MPTKKEQPKTLTEKRITISDQKRGLPYSKGLMASSIMASGLAPVRAYKVAKLIEEHLHEKEIYTLTAGQLENIASEILASKYGDDYAKRYLKWEKFKHIEKPLIILIGGITGVGKSTIATQVAYRLGITRIVSTDAIREVMRALFSKELMPPIYESSFAAWSNLRVPLPKSSDPVIIGFREQASAVIVGIKAIIERAVTEKTNLIIEGAHIVPGYLDNTNYQEKAFIIPFIIGIDDGELHRSHFMIRDIETAESRPYQKYLVNFENIRKLQNYIKYMAKENNVSYFNNRNLDACVRKILERIVNEVIGE